VLDRAVGQAGATGQCRRLAPGRDLPRLSRRRTVPRVRLRDAATRSPARRRPPRRARRCGAQPGRAGHGARGSPARRGIAGEPLRGGAEVDEVGRVGGGAGNSTTSAAPAAVPRCRGPAAPRRAVTAPGRPAGGPAARLVPRLGQERHRHVGRGLRGSATQPGGPGDSAGDVAVQRRVMGQSAHQVESLAMGLQRPR